MLMNCFGNLTYQLVASNEIVDLLGGDLTTILFDIAFKDS